MPLYLNGTEGVYGVNGTNSTPANRGSDTNTGIVYGTDTVQIATGGTTAVTVDSSQNVGIGVTPSAWTRPAIQNGAAGSVSYFAATNIGVMTSNVYFDGSNKYIATNPAVQYSQGSGQHSWSVAASGTAGNAITFTQAMTLDASGNLGIGITTPGSKIDIASGSGTAVTAVTIRSLAGNSNGFKIVTNSSTDDVSLINHYSAPLIFGTNNTERARITSSGELLVGGTTDNGAYNLQCNGTAVWGAGAYVNGSDERIKDNIQNIASCTDVVMSLRPVTFQYKPEFSKDTNIQPGFIAQDLQQALAGQVYEAGVVMEGPEYLSVAYQSLIPVLTKAIQELSAKLDAAEARIAALEAK